MCESGCDPSMKAVLGYTVAVENLSTSYMYMSYIIYIIYKTLYQEKMMYISNTK